MGAVWGRETRGESRRQPSEQPRPEPTPQIKPEATQQPRPEPHQPTRRESASEPQPLRQERSPLRLPLAGESVAAGFPSPADDYIDSGIDLNEALIRHPSSTFFLRVSGDSMTGAGIQHGDLLVVDRSLEARPGRIVVAVLDGAFTLKRLARHQGRLRLEAANSAYPPLELHRCGDVQIWGVAIHVIHSLEGHG
jgi:DNA polymerase V